jgi:hypothetical protein
MERVADNLEQNGPNFPNFKAMAAGTGLARPGTMNKQTSSGKKRQVETADTRVIVVEEAGELTAIVVDKVRGVIHIPLGTADPVPPFYS